MMAGKLMGIWNGCAFPTQETTLAFFEDGKGLMFFYWGSQGGPWVDEFKWAHLKEGELKIDWVTNAAISAMYDDEEDEFEEGEKPLERPDFSIATYHFEDNGLLVSIGVHDFENSLLDFCGKPGNFDELKNKLNDCAGNYQPFGNGRQVWLVGDKGRWHKTGFTVEPEKKPWWKFW